MQACILIEMFLELGAASTMFLLKAPMIVGYSSQADNSQPEIGDGRCLNRMHNVCIWLGIVSQ